MPFGYPGCGHKNRTYTFGIWTQRADHYTNPRCPLLLSQAAELCNEKTSLITNQLQSHYEQKQY